MSSELIELLQSMRELIMTGSIYCLFYFFELLPQVSLPFYAGHLGVEDIGAIGLYLTADMLVTNVFLIGIGLNFQGRMAQAFGSGDLKDPKALFQQTCIIGILIYLTMGIPILLNSSLLFLLIGQDTEISRLAGKCLVITIPGFFIRFFGELLLRIILAQKKIMQVILVSIIYGLAVVLLPMFFVWVLFLGVYGIAIAVTISLILSSIVIFCLILSDSSQKRFDFFDFQSNNCEFNQDLLKNYIYSILQLVSQRFQLRYLLSSLEFWEKII